MSSQNEIQLRGFGLGRLMSSKNTKFLHAIRFPGCATVSRTATKTSFVEYLTPDIPFVPMGEMHEALACHDFSNCICTAEDTNSSWKARRLALRGWSCETSVPFAAAHGDWICVLLGGSLIYILRPQPKDVRFEFVGAAWTDVPLGQDWKGSQTFTTSTSTPPSLFGPGSPWAAFLEASIIADFVLV